MTENKKWARKPPLEAGQGFGRWTVLDVLWRPTPDGKRRERWGLCQCSCGQQRQVRGSQLKSGQSTSCGCYNLELRRKHGHYVDGKQSPAYRSFYCMLSRCRNIKNPRYGGRGITVCDRWDPSKGGCFQAFLADMGEPPAGYTLERIDNNKNYEPTNCIWASKKQQANNRCSNRIVNYCGKEMTVAQALDLSGVPIATFYQRVQRGVSIEEALIPYSP